MSRQGKNTQARWNKFTWASDQTAGAAALNKNRASLKVSVHMHECLCEPVAWIAGYLCSCLGETCRCRKCMYNGTHGQARLSVITVAAVQPWNVFPIAAVWKLNSHCSLWQQHLMGIYLFLKTSPHNLWVRDDSRFELTTRTCRFGIKTTHYNLPLQPPKLVNKSSKKKNINIQFLYDSCI